MSNKTMGPIPYGTQHITEEDIEAVTETLKADYLTQGPKVTDFEEAFADYIGSDYAVAVSNGTAALHLGVLALGVEPGQKVITTPITFSASANCVRYAGGEVDFVDIDPETFLIDLDLVERKLRDSELGEYAGIIPVDFTGLAVDIERLRSIADQYGLWILEDACHAPGGSFENSEGEAVNCGDCRYAEAAIFSFHPVKHIAAGEGGMITTNSEELKKQLDILRTHGITKEPERLQENHGGWYYEMQQLGYNYRLTDIQSSLGLSQLKRADEGLLRRRRIAKKYDLAFSDLDTITTQKVSENERDNHHGFHLYVIQVDNRKEVYDYLRKHQIYSQIHYIPVHLLPYYRQFGWNKGDFPKAEQYYERCISLPMYPTLTDEQQEFVIEKVLDVVE
ncbi:UDP-4-amino-4,6-dideoxy-N-acetyl-beta-L-altrosamine transaminase [Aliifodinibius sp. S!AR15-10]|uniref:UDP-4-amino-4, 6-dideoxy-N-acetyl-beta-L-altrosamine transaminase n=1 Tax=Aliifodinibius sp. S!AR15-10 TaxID=2950437 RepID=UPI0028610249|nr:UDP-4-amino-4,6-dideoxy-N-acetyl-beta-L-altrosamine transaminase [Aliifodinibius sp. S!AR15-10]MDR8393498.1 UDP-4-amino-4,6-dideoxy-N-acetyl-beta-L-altrosamine transaminase [Aliifodinibius sp. S!AR15-10]